MPNGGIDNCFTCWFNARNEGEANMAHINRAGENFCLIRQLKIEGDPAHTYCANHPSNTSKNLDPSEKIEVPIGGIYKASLDTGITLWPPDPYIRVLWHPAPDHEEVRQKLLGLLKRVSEIPTEYGGEMPWDDMVIYQLGEYQEPRAIEELRRIARFDPATKASYGHRNRVQTVWLAQQALYRIQRPTSSSSGSYLNLGLRRIRKPDDR